MKRTFYLYLRFQRRQNFQDVRWIPGHGWVEGMEIASHPEKYK